MLDGEIVIDADDGGQDFGALQQRIHPAVSRITMLAEQTPAAMSPSTCWPRTTTRCSTGPSPSAAARLEELADGGST